MATPTFPDCARINAQPGQAWIMAWTSELSLGEKSMQPIRQSDVAILPLAQIFSAVAAQELMTNLTHLTLAEGEVTGHKHRIIHRG